MRLESLLERQAGHLPGHEFAVDLSSGERLTYQSLRNRSVDMAATLQSLGVRPGSNVAVLLPNRAEYYVVLFAVWRCRATAVLLNPALTESERDFLLSLTGAAAVVTDMGAVQRACTAEPPSGEDVALILFTSGSSGNPKGVMLTHDALLENARVLADDYQFGGELRALNGLPLHTMFGVGDLTLLPLFCGGTTVLHNGWDFLSLRSFWKIVADERITFFGIVPSLVRLLLQFTRLQPDLDMGALRFGLSASAPLAADLQQSFEATFHCLLASGYGMSETTTLTFCSPYLVPRKYGCVGRPSACELEVVGVPPGQVGEIRVRSNRLMRGYFQNGAATREVLRDGWMYTGDLGWLDADGDLYLCGRSKDMAIINGVKVFPEEVEEALVSHPDVSETVVVAVGEELHAFVVPRDAAVLSVSHLADYARQRLAAFKRPRHYVLVSELPRSANGKVLREELRRRAAAPPS